jgi:hypothetical protein
MAWHVEYLPDQNIIRIAAKGPMTFEDYEEQTIEAIELDKKHNSHLFLSDHSEAVNKAPVSEIVDFPALYERSGATSVNKLAVVLPKSPFGTDDYRLYETICRNRGWNVQLFEDEHDAIGWLSP